MKPEQLNFPTFGPDLIVKDDDNKIDKIVLKKFKKRIFRLIFDGKKIGLDEYQPEFSEMERCLKNFAEKHLDN